jgi:hypothetical protein
MASNPQIGTTRATSSFYNFDHFFGSRSYLYKVTWLTDPNENEIVSCLYPIRPVCINHFLNFQTGQFGWVTKWFGLIMDRIGGFWGKPESKNAKNSILAGTEHTRGRTAVHRVVPSVRYALPKPKYLWFLLLWCCNVSIHLCYELCDVNNIQD